MFGKPSRCSDCSGHYDLPKNDLLLTVLQLLMSLTSGTLQSRLSQSSTTNRVSNDLMVYLRISTFRSRPQVPLQVRERGPMSAQGVMKGYLHLTISCSKAVVKSLYIPRFNSFGFNSSMPGFEPDHCRGSNLTSE